MGNKCLFKHQDLEIFAFKYNTYEVVSRGSETLIKVGDIIYILKVNALSVIVQN